MKQPDTIQHFRLLEASYNERLSAVKFLEERLNNKRTELEGEEESMRSLEKLLELLQQLTALKKKETTDRIEKLVSLDLQKIFEDPSYQFFIEQDTRGAHILYKFVVKSDSFLEAGKVNISNSRGGGIVNIVSFLLRFILLALMSKTARRFLVQDEVFNNLSVNYHENLVLFIKELCDKLDVQIVFITHQPTMEIVADTVYELVKEGSFTSARRLL